MSQNAINSTKPIPISQGCTGNTSFTTNGVVYYDGSKLTSTAAGSAQQALTSAGPTSPPVWGAVPSGSGNWKLIQTQTVTNATSVTWTSLGSYQNFVVIYSSITGAGSDLCMYFSTNGGSSWVTSGYISTLWYWYSGNAYVFMYVNGPLGICFGTGLTTTLASGGMSGIFYLSGMNQVGGYPSVQGDGYNLKMEWQKVGGFLNVADNYNAIEIWNSGPSAFSGTFSLYGVQ